ncbi:MAG: hypothetical protein IKN16_04110 [Selenomonadaceae bacterium]|nr:hypothetical protein [Selenomonadaceae bacterium]
MFKRTIAAVTILVTMLWSAVYVEAVSPKLSPDRAIQALAEDYAFGTGDDSAAMNFISTTLNDYSLMPMTKEKILSAYAAKLKSVMGITTRLKKNDAKRPIVTVTARTIDVSAAEHSEGLLALKADSRLQEKTKLSLLIDPEYQSFALESVNKFIDEMPLTSAKSFDVTCTLKTDSNGNYYWTAEDLPALQNFLVPTFETDSSNALDRLLFALGGGFNSEDTYTPSQPTYVPQTPSSGDYSGTGDNWLIYWYICGTDLESGDQSATNDIEEVGRVNLPPNVKILIQTGSTKNWHHHIVNNGRYKYEGNRFQKISDVNSNMGDPATLQSFLSYGKEFEKTFKPDHRILIFWDHGGPNGVCTDEYTKQRLSRAAIKSTLESLYTPSVKAPPFEIIGFDACLMSSMESARSIEGFARYMVASEAEEDFKGWHYTDWLNELVKNPKTTGANLGEKICLSSYNNSSKKSEATFSVVDMAQFSNLSNAHQNFFSEAVTRAKNSKGFATEFHRIAKNPKTEEYDNWYVDLKSLATNTQYLMPTSSSNLLNAINNAIVGTPYNGNLRTGGGISTYYPYLGLNSKSFITETQTEFYSMIRNVPYGKKSSSETSNIGAKSEGGYDLSSLKNIPVQLDDNNRVIVKLTPEQMENVSQIQGVIVPNFNTSAKILSFLFRQGEGNAEMGIKDEAAVFLGNNPIIDADWQQGIFRDNFQTQWAMLDGHLVSMYLTFISSDYELYEVPVVINNEACMLQFSYTPADETYTLIGLNKSGGEDSGGRYNVSINAGDEITPVFFAYIPDKDTVHFGKENKETGNLDIYENENIDLLFEVTNKDGVLGYFGFSKGNSFMIDDKPTLTKNNLDDGSYTYFFRFVAPDDSIAFSQAVTFNVKDGRILFGNVEKENPLLPWYGKEDVKIEGYGAGSNLGSYISG